MNASLLTEIATILAVGVAIWAIFAQTNASKKQKVIDVFRDCTSTFQAPMRERMEIDILQAASEIKDKRARYHYSAYWELLTSEYEFALSGYIPKELFLRWFEIMHRELHAAPDAIAVGCISPMAGWELIGRAQVSKVSPVFAKAMRIAERESDFELVLPDVKALLDSDRKESVFKKL